MANPNVWSPENTAQLIQQALTQMKGTSDSTVAYGIISPTKTFVTQTGLYFDVGQWLLVVDQADTANYLVGQVTSYDATTGDLVMEAQYSVGIGTNDSWYLYLSGPYVASQWDGGVVTGATDFQSTLEADGVFTANANIEAKKALNLAGKLSITSGDPNLDEKVVLPDAASLLTAAQLFKGTLYIEPTADRELQLPTAADIITALGAEAPVGSHYEFVLVNDSARTLSITGNTGITQIGVMAFAEGSATYKVVKDSSTLVSVINMGSPLVKAGAGDIDTAAIAATSSDIVLDSTSAKLQSITMTAEGNSVILPPATTLAVASPVFVFRNDGYYEFGIRNASGELLAAIPARTTVTVSLLTNATVAGDWLLGGQGLISGLLKYTSLLSSTYSGSSLLAHGLKLNDTTSIHCAAITANGFAVFAIDHTNEAVGTPTSISTSSNMRPCGLFKITNTTFIVFYTSTADLTTMNAVVVTLSGTTTLAAGTPASRTVASSSLGADDGYGAPKIAQLDTNLFGICYANTTSHYVVGVQVSAGDTVTIGTAVAAPNGGANSASVIQANAVFPNSTTTGLLFYKVGVADPWAGKAVVFSITNANPPVVTYGTEVATITSDETTMNAVEKLTDTVFAVVDNTSTAAIDIKLVSVTGTAASASSASEVFATGFGVTGNAYTSHEATRYAPALRRLADTQLFLYLETNTGSVAAPISANYPTITVGNIVKDSLFTTTSNAAGAGRVVAYKDSTLLVAQVSGDAVAGIDLIPHTVIANELIVGKPKQLFGGTDQINTAASLDAVLLSNGTFASDIIVSGAKHLGSMIGTNLVDSDGVTAVSLGNVATYACLYKAPIAPGAAVMDGKLVLLQGERALNATTEITQLRVSVIDLAI